ncbi:GntR family transcriptional regulator, partial [Bordetella pertussis]
MSAARLFARSPQPLYLQAAAVFRGHIQTGVWRPGRQIPPLDAL